MFPNVFPYDSAHKINNQLRMTFFLIYYMYQFLPVCFCIYLSLSLIYFSYLSLSDFLPLLSLHILYCEFLIKHEEIISA